MQSRAAVGYAKSYGRSHDVVIRVPGVAGKVIELHRHKGDFKEPVSVTRNTKSHTGEG